MNEFEHFARMRMEPVLELIRDLAEENIIAQDIFASGDLIESLEVTLADNFDIILQFNDYGAIQDQGLSGSDFIRQTPYSVNQSVFTGDAEDNAFEQARSTDDLQSRSVIVAFENIRTWIDLRGIPTFTDNRNVDAAIIADSIRRLGYEPRPWIDKTLNDPRIAEFTAEAFELALQDELDTIEF